MEEAVAVGVEVPTGDALSVDTGVGASVTIGISVGEGIAACCCGTTKSTYAT